MKSYSSIVVVFCTTLYGCGSMPSPNSPARNSDSSQQLSSAKVKMPAQKVRSNKSLDQVLKQNGISDSGTIVKSKSVVRNAPTSSLVVNNVEKDRHNRILAAIKTTEVKKDQAAVASALVTPVSNSSASNRKTGQQSPRKSVATKVVKKKKGTPKLKVAIATKPNFSEDAVKYNLANRYYQSGKYQNSIDILESTKNDISKTVKNRDLLVLAYTAYARELVSRADLLEAQTILEKALTMQPKNKTIRRQLSGIKNVREADRVYKYAVDSYNKGKRQKAFKSFARVLSLNPSHKKAKKYYSKIKTIVVDSYHKKALQYYRRQKLSQAIVEWNSLLKVDPANDLARIYRSRAIELQKKFEKL